MAIHAHLEEAHPDRVKTRRDDEAAFAFVLRCPECGSEAERRVNPRGRERNFLEEFGREIRLVAFDILLYHMQADHPQAVGLPPHPPSAEGESRSNGSVPNGR